MAKKTFFSLFIAAVLLTPAACIFENTPSSDPYQEYVEKAIECIKEVEGFLNEKNSLKTETAIENAQEKLEGYEVEFQLAIHPIPDGKKKQGLQQAYDAAARPLQQALVKQEEELTREKIQSQRAVEKIITQIKSIGEATYYTIEKVEKAIQQVDTLKQQGDEKLENIEDDAVSTTLTADLWIAHQEATEQLGIKKEKIEREEDTKKQQKAALTQYKGLLGEILGLPKQLSDVIRYDDDPNQIDTELSTLMSKAQNCLLTAVKNSTSDSNKSLDKAKSAADTAINKFKKDLEIVREIERQSGELVGNLNKNEVTSANAKNQLKSILAQKNTRPLLYERFERRITQAETGVNQAIERRKKVEEANGKIEEATNKLQEYINNINLQTTSEINTLFNQTLPDLEQNILTDTNAPAKKSGSIGKEDFEKKAGKLREAITKRQQDLVVIEAAKTHIDAINKIKGDIKVKGYYDQGAAAAKTAVTTANADALKELEKIQHDDTKKDEQAKLNTAVDACNTMIGHLAVFEQAEKDIEDWSKALNGENPDIAKARKNLEEIQKRKNLKDIPQTWKDSLNIKAFEQKIDALDKGAIFGELKERFKKAKTEEKYNEVKSDFETAKKELGQQTVAGEAYDACVEIVELVGKVTEQVQKDEKILEGYFNEFNQTTRNFKATLQAIDSAVRSMEDEISTDFYLVEKYTQLWNTYSTKFDQEQKEMEQVKAIYNYEEPESGWKQLCTKVINKIASTGRRVSTNKQPENPLPKFNQTESLLSKKITNVKTKIGKRIEEAFSPARFAKLIRICKAIEATKGSNPSRKGSTVYVEQVSTGDGQLTAKRVFLRAQVGVFVYQELRELNEIIEQKGLAVVPTAQKNQHLKRNKPLTARDKAALEHARDIFRNTFRQKR